MSDSFHVQFLSKVSSASNGLNGSKLLSFAANESPNSSFSAVYQQQNGASQARRGSAASDVESGQSLPRERSSAASNRQDNRPGNPERGDRPTRAGDRTETQAQSTAAESSNLARQEMQTPADAQTAQSAPEPTPDGSTKVNAESGDVRPDADGTSSAVADQTVPSDAQILAGEVAAVSAMGADSKARLTPELADRLGARLSQSEQDVLAATVSAPLAAKLSTPATMTESGTAITTGPRTMGLQALNNATTLSADVAATTNTVEQGKLASAAVERGVSGTAPDLSETDAAALARQMGARALAGTPLSTANAGATTGPLPMGEIGAQTAVLRDNLSRQALGDEARLQSTLGSTALGVADGDTELAAARQTQELSGDLRLRADAQASREFALSSGYERLAATATATASASDRMMTASAQASSAEVGDWSLLREGISATASSVAALQASAEGAARAPVTRSPDMGLTTAAVGALPGVGASGVSGSAPAASSTSLVAEYALQRAPQDPEFAGELSTRVKTLLRDGVREARLQLNPAELGRLQVTITTEGDQARVAFVADSLAAKDAIEQSMPRLREMLEQNGLQLAQSDVGQRSFDSEAGSTDGESASEDGGLLQADGESSDESVQDRAAGYVSAPGLLDTYI